jgi:ankyrin repeat protein
MLCLWLLKSRCFVLGNIDLVKAILAQDVMQRDACTMQDGATPLMFAAMLGHLEIVRLLVEYGCDINKQDTISGWTALMQATFHGLVFNQIFILHQATSPVAFLVLLSKFFG